MPFCYSCSNSSSCDTCNTNYNYSITNFSCYLDCSPITYCATCSLTTSLNCLQCSIGYSVRNNSCLPVCGDGILVIEENCDDGNLKNGDGCSSTCVLEAAFLCTNITSNTSNITSCNPCLLNCIDCTGNINDCVMCGDLYIYNSSGVNITCDPDCTPFPSCRSCTLQHCLFCRQGYTLSSTFNCVPICGDGILMLG